MSKERLGYNVFTNQKIYRQKLGLSEDVNIITDSIDGLSINRGEYLQIINSFYFKEFLEIQNNKTKKLIHSAGWGDHNGLDFTIDTLTVEDETVKKIITNSDSVIVLNNYNTYEKARVGLIQFSQSGYRLENKKENNFTKKLKEKNFLTDREFELVKSIAFQTLGDGELFTLPMDLVTGVVQKNTKTGSLEILFNNWDYS